MIEEQLDKLRKDYQKIDAPSYLGQNGWSDLLLRLDQQVIHEPVPIFSYRLAFAVFAILLIGAALGFSRISGPGDALYPVKIASDKIYAQVTGDYNVAIEGRAEEVVEASDEDAEEAARQYQQAVDEAQEKEGDSQKFKDTLGEQEERLRSTQSQNPHVQEAIRHTQEARGQVQGQKDQHAPQNNNSNQGGQKGKNK